MGRIAVVALIATLFVAGCNTMDGLVTDVDRGVSKIQGDNKK